MQEQVCTHCYNIASKNLNREFCKSLYTLLEPNAAEALPCNHHKSMDLLSSWFLKIFSVHYWQSCNLHCKFLQKVVPPSLPQKTIPISTKKKSIRHHFMQKENHSIATRSSNQKSEQDQQTAACSAVRCSAGWFVDCYFTTLDFSAMFLVKSANSCMKGLA